MIFAPRVARQDSSLGLNPEFSTAWQSGEAQVKIKKRKGKIVDTRDSKIKRSRFKSGIRASRKKRVKFCKAAYKLHPLSGERNISGISWRERGRGWMQLRELIRRPCSDVLRNISRVARDSGFRAKEGRKYHFKLEPWLIHVVEYVSRLFFFSLFAHCFPRICQIITYEQYACRDRIV